MNFHNLVLALCAGTALGFLVYFGLQGTDLYAELTREPDDPLLPDAEDIAVPPGVEPL